jgi:hypothetical protein
MRTSLFLGAAATMGIGLIASATGGPVTIPNTFTPGTPAKAANVNANFSAVATAVNGSAQDIANLQTAVKNIPAGPRGPAGPQGAQGPTGPGALMVKDSTGQVVGSYLPVGTVVQPSLYESVFIRTSTLSFAVSFSSSQLGLPNNTTLFYTSSNCTGTAYLPSPPTIGVLPSAVVINTTAYIAGSTASNFAPGSYWNPAGGCMGPGGAGYFVPVVATFNLSTLNLVPPFSVQ